MKLLKNAFLIVLAISSHSLSAMRALQEAQKTTAQRAQLASMSPTQRVAVAAAEQEKKATATLKKLRKGQPEGGSGIKIFGSDKNPIPLELEVKYRIPGVPNWYPTADALTNLLNTYEPLKKYLPGMPEVIVEKSDKAGIRTGATFVAYRKKNSKEEKRPLLFLKIGAEGSEFVPKKLDNLQKGPVGRFGLKALSNPELPIIVLQEMFFIYQDQNKKQYTIEVMHLAHGKQLFDLIDSHDQDDQQWAEKIGKALGLFHLEFMNYHNSKDPEKWKTVIHGDFHLGNVFFDEKTSRVYFIDNGDMHEDNPFKDFPNIHRILLLALNEYEATPDPFKNRKINFCLSFIKGYLSAYPLAKRKLLVPYMKAKLKFDEKLKEYTRKWPNEPDTKFIEKVVTSLNEIFEKACKQ